METSVNPQGAAARVAWRQLDPSVRKAVRRGARRLTPHPDPAVAAIAVGYARDGLDRLRLPGRRFTIGLLSMVLALVFIALALSPAAWRSPVSSSLLAAYIAVLACCGVVAAVAFSVAFRRIGGRRRGVTLARMELVNLRTLPAGLPVLQPAGSQRPAQGTPPAQVPRATTPGGEPPPPDQVMIRYDRRKYLSATGQATVLCAFTIGVTAGLASFAIPGAIRAAAMAVLVPLDLLVALLLALNLFALTRWVLRRRAITVLDGAGVSFPTVSYTVPWGELAEIDLHPMRGLDGRPARNWLIAFVPADPGAALASFRPRPRRMLGSRSLRAYGTPLTINDRLLEQTADEIIDAAARFTQISVRRFDSPGTGRP